MTQPYTHDSWQAWYDNLSAPFNKMPCGEDLKYEDDFKFLKSSFSEIEALDHKKIFTLATGLLSEKSKDLRIASYVCCAASGEFGVEGLTFALKLFNHFIAEYFEQVHPISARAKKGVHTWLLSQQLIMITALENIANYQPEQLIALQEELSIYGSVSVRKLDENAGPLSDIANWLVKIIKANPVEVAAPVVLESKPEKNEAIKQVNSTDTQNNANDTQSDVVAVSQATGTTNVAAQVLESDSDYLSLIRKLLTFDKDQNNTTRFIQLARATRWSNLKLPPNENGKTRLPAPRAGVFVPIKNSLDNQDFNEALLKAEALFMEGAMHFNMDLQALVISALKGLNKQDALSQLELTIFGIINNYPQLLNLQYEDGSGFCSPTSKETIQAIKQQFSVSTDSTVADDEFATIQQKAIELVDKKQLEQALNLTKTLIVNTEFDQARVLLIKAQLCLKAERYDFAEPLLQQLLTQIEQHDLGQWHSDFCMQVWRNSVLCFSTLSTKARDHYDGLASNLKQKMILTQPERALGWL